MKFCTQCGHGMKDEEQYCIMCGCKNHYIPEIVRSKVGPKSGSFNKLNSSTKDPNSYIPFGFRSGKWYKMLIAILYFIAIFLLVLGTLFGAPNYTTLAVDKVIYYLCSIVGLLIFVFPYIVLSNFFGLRYKLPLFKSKRYGLTLVGLASITFILVILFGVINSFHSTEYKMAAALADSKATDLNVETTEAGLFGNDSGSAKSTEEPQSTNNPQVASPSTESSNNANNGVSAPSIEPVIPNSDADTQNTQIIFDNPTLSSNFIDACSTIGIDINSIKNLNREADWQVGPRYSFTFNGMRFLLYCNADNTINSINLGDVRLYLQGFTPLQVSNYTVDTNTTTYLQMFSKDYVNATLTNPDTANYPLFGWSFSRFENIYVVTNTVKAENSFGVEDEIPFYMEYKVAGENISLVYFVLNGEAITGSKSAIVEPNRTEIAISSSNTSVADSEIKLVYGQKGSYGKTVTIGNEDYIWYYVPKGTYSVTSNVKYCKVFLDQNNLITNSDGYKEHVNVTTLEFTALNQTKTLTVGNDEHIFLMINASVTLKSVNP